MANTMLTSFFDQRYMSEECCCHSDMMDERCPHHNPTAAISCVSGEGVGQPKVVPVEINQSFPRQPILEHLIPLIEYRIKILALDDYIILPGQGGKVKTNTSITRKAGKLSMLLKPAENLSLRCNSEGLISPFFRGALSVEFENSGSDKVHICAGSLIAYLVMTPFIK